MTGRRGRVGVLDIGCFSAGLVVVDDSPLRPVLVHKTRLRLDRALDRDNRLRADGVTEVVHAVRTALRVIEDADVAEFVPFATSVVRDAPNADEVLAEVRARTGFALRVMTGEQEARLSYRAARAWFGWSAGPLLVLDVGGGTVEIARGDTAVPGVVASRPLGARTLTRRGLTDPAAVRAELSEVLVRNGLTTTGPVRAVGCSKVFQQLARLTGARPQRDGPHVPRRLHLADLRAWLPRLAAMSAAKRARLPGISRHRAEQSPAGAIVVEALMTVTGHDVVDISPWSTREGLLLDLVGRGEDRGTDYSRVA
ncbi:Ppx/GppA phosphatase family protein [Saccharothrix violaceirubra]|uniref:Exopolyphosphatase/guanosine-5'-triphosphate, 3'-diphosphate pyrophosphatase n=1 Tax=Saccharothrix violaceirubra TaxID=413306 RepID=A0A7W7T1C5_9PSEU|nr:exopolyphosphatase [Saccharothrix violaceirubra]MBB4964748.1 exopolyphosphatase/guanosine-5'-triphosphate,3'-diphosphate pyrophosphatase [Saccharothrix violaceirubra]